MPDKLGNKIRLQHILDAIKEIRSYTKGVDFKTFKKNSMMLNACIRQLEVIGEACNRLDEKILEENSDIEWKQIIGLRNFLIHQYFGVDAKIVWNIIQHDINDLRKRAKKIIKTLETE